MGRAFDTPADTRFQPGWWLNDQLRFQYGGLRNGVLERMGHALMPIVGWLKRHPRHEGRLGRIPRATFDLMLKDTVPVRQRRYRYLAQWREDGFVTELTIRGIPYIDLGFWDDLACRRNLAEHRAKNAERQRAHRSAKRAADRAAREAAEQAADEAPLSRDVTPPPATEPLSPPSEASCEVSRLQPLEIHFQTHDTTSAQRSAPVLDVAVEPVESEPAALRELRSAMAAPADREPEDCGSGGSPAGMVGADRGEPQLLGLGGQTTGWFAIPAAVAGRLARGEDDPTPDAYVAPKRELGYRPSERPHVRNPDGEVVWVEPERPRRLDMPAWLESIGWTEAKAGQSFAAEVMEGARVRLERWNPGNGPLQHPARAFTRACQHIAAGVWEQPHRAVA